MEEGIVIRREIEERVNLMKIKVRVDGQTNMMNLSR